MDKPPAPEEAPPSKYGTAALRSLLVCGLLGIPLLFAFGLGVLVWVAGLLSALAGGLTGLLYDRDRTRATTAILLVCGIAVALWMNGRR